jgi:tetrapyrrole methylase family protein/MazG family protein
MAVTAGPVLVVGLGPGPPDLVSPALNGALSRAPTSRFVRTRRHPSASALPDATSFDDVYEGGETMEGVYREIVERLVHASVRGAVLYAVPGSPMVAERTVELLRSDDRVAVEVAPAVSFLDLAWDRLGVDPLAAGVRLVDGQRFEVEAAGCAGPLLVAQCDSAAVLSDIKLSVDGGPEVTVLARLGLPDESVRTVAWEHLDRSVEPDHLTSLWVPGLAVPVASELVRFAQLVRTLRERCPWDRQQTHRSLTRHLLEETYEVLEAIDELPAGYPHLEEELGDLLFQVAFHATLAAEKGWFTLADVAAGVHDKLVARHPHVFGDVEAATAEAVMENWEQIKRREKGRSSAMDGVPGALPALLYADKVQRRAASVGFDWPDAAGARAKLAEELAELEAEIAGVDGTAGGGVPVGDGPPARGAGDAGASDRSPDRVAGEMGDLLFAAVNVARHLGVDAEAALRDASAKFRRRFQAVEDLARPRTLSDLSLADMDDLWEAVKQSE